MHPLHLMFVPVPIALLSASVAFDPGGGKVETGDVAVLFVARCFGRSLVYELSVGVAAQR